MDRVEGNRVSGSLRYGIAVFPTAYWVPMPFDPRPVPPGRHEPWRPQGNVIRGNTVTGSSVADLALADGSGPGNCFAANQATSTLPQDLQAGCTPDSVGDPLVATELTAPIPAMVDRALRRLGEKPYTAMPVPPPQPSMPTR